jgi:hypothetical protein
MEFFELLFFFFFFNFPRICTQTQLKNYFFLFITLFFAVKRFLLLYPYFLILLLYSFLMAPCASPNSKTLKRQSARKKLIASQRKSYGQARVEKHHHDELASTHLLASAQTADRMKLIEDDIMDASMLQAASKSAASNARMQDVSTIRQYLVASNEDNGSVVVTKCAHLVVSVYQSQTSAKDTQMKGYQHDSGFSNGDFASVRRMALDHYLLLQNDVDNTCSFNDDYDELVHSHKSE